MKIIFLRHGKTNSNKEKCFSTAKTQIIEEGYEDLDKAKNNLKTYNFKEVYTSKLLRSKQTAEYLGFTSFKEDSRLNEMDFGDFKGKNIEKCLLEYRNLYKKIKEDPFSSKYPNGESRIDVINRLSSFMEEKSKLDYDILCISHGIAIRSSLFYVLKDLSNFDSFWLDNGSLTVFDLKENKKIIECVNLI